MKMIIKGKNIELTEDLHRYVEKKLGKLKRYFDRIIEIVVTLSMEKNRKIAEATLKVSRTVIRAEESTDDMFASIDKMADKLERQIKKYKQKLSQRNYPEKSDIVSPEEKIGVSADDGLFEIPRIVRTKKVPVKRMSPEEAALQIDLLDYDFYAFLNDETEKLNIIYRRKGEGFGLLELEIPG